MHLLRNYEIAIILTEEFNDNELKAWAFNFAKSLKQFHFCDISVISRGKNKLTYSLKNQVQGNYIQLNFSSMPKSTNKVLNKLKVDTNVLRYLILKKKIS